MFAKDISFRGRFASQDEFKSPSHSRVMPTAVGKIRELKGQIALFDWNPKNLQDIM